MYDLVKERKKGLKDEATKEVLSFRIKTICYVTESLCRFPRICSG